MPRNKGGGVLTDSQKKKFQGRLAHFFRDHRYRNHLEPKDVAHKLGYASVARYSTLESENIPYPRFVTSLDFLSSIAALEGMCVGDFVCYLEGKQESDRPRSAGRALTKWEQALLDAFAPVSIGIRRAFTNFCKETVESRDKKKLEMILEIANILHGKDEKAVEALLNALQFL
ncbi:MAG: hypothetical protein H6618_08805 [Deltaproteobacteria bacterium]|nr:hypothetical protein [Deltaproteobacteria bacterium]